MSVIEQLFGKGTQLKDLDKEQKKLLFCEYQRQRFAKMTEEERLDYYNASHTKYREKNRDAYLKYQREYRMKRREEDPEFKKRVNEISKHSARRKKARQEEANGQ